MAQALIDNLNEQQLEIVTAPPSNMLVLAGAGTGKTRVLIARIAYLMEVEHYRPHNILAVTFTNKAAKEMNDRLCAALEWEKNYGLKMSTFHSLCNSILRYHYVEAKLPSDFTILSSSDQQSIMRKFYNDHGIKLKDEEYGNLKDYDLDIKTVINRITYAKDNNIPPLYSGKDIEKLIAKLSDNWRSLQPNSLFDIFYAAYCHLCHVAGVLDFSDLINKVVELLRTNEKVRTYYQERFRYIFVDEFQDTNLPQYNLLLLLKSNFNHIFVVGDDDQSIYGWRGAKIENLINIKNDVEDIKCYELSINYRSNQNILTYANAVISYGSNRMLNKFLTTQEFYDELKRVDIELLSRFDYEEMTQLQYENKNADVVELKGPEDLENLSSAQRDFLINALRQAKTMSKEDYLARQQYRWENHGDLTDTNHLVKLVTITDNLDDGTYVERSLARLLKLGVKYEDIAILYRNNSLSMSIENKLVERNIPYQVYGGMKFYERSEVLDVLAYLRLLLNPKDDVAFYRVVNVPKRGIGDTAVAKLQDYASMCGLSLYESIAYFVKNQDRVALKSFSKCVPFYSLIEELKLKVDDTSLESLIHLVVEKTGLDNYYNELDTKERSARLGVSRLENIEQLEANALLFSNSGLVLDDDSFDAFGEPYVRDGEDYLTVDLFGQGSNEQVGLGIDYDSSDDLNEQEQDEEPAIKFYERSEVVNLLSYMRLLADPKDDDSFVRVINAPNRGIGKATLNELQKLATKSGNSLYETLEELIKNEDRSSLRSLSKFEPFYELIESIKKSVDELSVAELISLIADKSGLKELYTELDSKESVKDHELTRAQMVYELESQALRANDLTEFLDQDFSYDDTLDEPLLDSDIKVKAPKTNMATNRDILVSFVNHTSLMSSAESTAQGTLQERGIQLMTIHASKGLEFRAVIIVGMDQDTLPSLRAENLDEERRLAYVALTRAKEYLFVGHNELRYHYSGGLEWTEDSQFTEEARELFNKYSIAKRPYRLMRVGNLSSNA